MLTSEAIKTLLEEYDNLNSIEKGFVRRELIRSQKRNIVITHRFVKDMLNRVIRQRVVMHTTYPGKVNIEYIKE